MDPHAVFCPNSACPARGQRGQGNITIHSQREQRYRCTACGHTFSARKGTPFYRQQYPEDLIALVVTLLAHGCPPSALVIAFALNWRTVQRWAASASQHAQAVHEQVVEQPRDHGHVQADELRVKTQTGIIWVAMAIQVQTRLWLGGVRTFKIPLANARSAGQPERGSILVGKCARGALRALCAVGLAEGGTGNAQECVADFMAPSEARL